MTRQVTLPSDTTAARIARKLVREALSDQPHAEEFVDDAELVTSELVANAVSHGKPPFDLTLDVEPTGVRVTVTNGGAAGEPHVETASADSGRGRGLAMVDTLSDDWGWEREADRISVWAQINAR